MGNAFMVRRNPKIFFQLGDLLNAICLIKCGRRDLNPTFKLGKLK
jgi:hypothetical protein